MPIIASQHTNAPWRPLLEWPEDAFVQWGGRGIVLAGNDSYQTAFFEVFPKDGSAGFIRGEGEGLEAAEADAHKTWVRQSGCHATGGHRWTRAMRKKGGGAQTYTNGGCFCLKCGSFQTVMPPIVELGAWRKPLSVMEIDGIAMGFCRPTERGYTRSREYSRKLGLRARMSGIHLPPVTPKPDGLRIFEQDAYELACQRAVGEFYIANRERLENQTPDGSVIGFFDGMALRHLKCIAEDMLEEPGASS
jgi:hypothetical protein